MSPLLFAYLLGRFIGSWFLVWIVCLVFSRFALKTALRRSFSWKGWLATFAVFGVTLAYRLS